MAKENIDRGVIMSSIMDKLKYFIGIDDLDLEEDDVAAKTKTIEVFLPPAKAAGKILEENIQDQVKELVSLLHTEAKVV